MKKRLFAMVGLLLMLAWSGSAGARPLVPEPPADSCVQFDWYEPDGASKSWIVAYGDMFGGSSFITRFDTDSEYSYEWIVLSGSIIRTRLYGKKCTPITPQQ